MRPPRYDVEIAGGNLMDKRSLDLERAKEAWDQWEIHCLILLSLALQVFLSLTADLRRRSASRMLSTLLWLAYLSADTVAVFVLGHLAVHAQGPSHELMLFWAPFVLLHLGGQDTITAFSKQDNELWTRHLLGLVSQTAVAGYVVSKSSWPDTRLRAAMVLMFLCGFLKYSGRTYCLYSASPKSLKASSMGILSDRLSALRDDSGGTIFRQKADFIDDPAIILDEMFRADKCWEIINRQIHHVLGLSMDDIMLLDAPIDDEWMVTIFADMLPAILKEKNRPDRCIVYQYVAASLGQSYQWLYTKAPLSKFVHYWLSKMPGDHTSFWLSVWFLLKLMYILFQCILTTIALVLFVSAQKEGHHSKADITVSYILLVGALVLDLLPASTSIVSHVRKPFRPVTVSDCAEMVISSCLRPLGWRTKKQWSDELAQYSMIRRYTSVQGYHGFIPFIRKWIKPFVGAWCAEFLDLTCTPVTDDLKLFVLDRLLLFLQTSWKQEWDFASFRGERALRKWMDISRVPEPQRSGYALHKSLSSRVEFPASVLIWHLATDICYFSDGNGPDTELDETKHKKKMSRELSHYIMYLVFKCDVLLTSNSGLVHQNAHEQLTEYFAQVHLDEKETVMRMFEAVKKEKQQQAGSMQWVIYRKTNIFLEKNRKTNIEAPVNKDDDTTSSGSGMAEELKRRTLEALSAPVLPLARDVAQELIDIHDEAQRWELISEVWLEMLFYTAHRCGAAFHYEHLSTGGEFITHVLFLMRYLGPFMPKPDA